MNYSHSVFDPYPTHTLWRVKTHFTQCQVKIKTHQKRNNSWLPGLWCKGGFALVAGWYHSDLCTKQTLGRWNRRIILFASTGTQRAPLGFNISDKKEKQDTLVSDVCAAWLASHCCVYWGSLQGLHSSWVCRGHPWEAFLKNRFPLASFHST